MDDPFSDMPLDDPFDEVEETLGDLWMERMIGEATKREGRLAGHEEEDDQPMYARSVKYHRDRDFLDKYGWVRIIDPKTSKVVYRHTEGTWAEQPSVKAARRAMRDFFNQRREERRNSDPMAQKRRRDCVEKLATSDVEDVQSESSPRRVAVLPVPSIAIKCEEGTTPLSLPATAVLPSAPAQTLLPQPLKTDPDEAGSKRARIVSQPVAPDTPPLLPPQLPYTADEVDEDDLEPGDDMDKCLRRKARNRQAAAKSRQRQQDHRRALEDENKRLQVHLKPSRPTSTLTRCKPTPAQPTLSRTYFNPP